MGIYVDSVSINPGCSFLAVVSTAELEQVNADYQSAPQVREALVLQLKCTGTDESQDMLVEIEDGPAFALSANGRILTALSNCEDYIGGVTAGERLKVLGLTA
jgi:hypothetical protein